MNEIMSINPDDARLTRQLVYESQAATAAYESTRIRNVCLGTGAVVLAAGIGLAALVWAWNHGVDPEALKAALANMPPLKVEATLDPNARVKMADGKVVLADGGMVSIDPNATVKIVGEVASGNNAALQRQLEEIQKQPRSDSTVIKRKVTVFNSVAYAGGDVTTGWEYTDGGADKPSDQFCYYRANDRVIDLAQGGKVLRANSRKLPFFNEALTKCQWWNGA